ncbi:MAG: hybrid sensor histidine kinase/response regulator, partial [Acidimicrobiales bacterium]
IEDAGTPGHLPPGRDEIGRLAARLDKAAIQVRQHVEERDRARRELTDILTAIPVVSLRYDFAQRSFSYASPNVQRLLGVTAEEVMADARVVIDRFHPDDSSMLRNTIGGGRGRGADRVPIVLRFRRDPSSENWQSAEAIYMLETGPEGEPRSVGAYLADVSERYVAQRVAEKRRFLLESIFHASPDTIVVRDNIGGIVLASSTLAEVIGSQGDGTLSPDELIEEAYRYGHLRREDHIVIEQLIAKCTTGERNLAPVITTGRGDRKSEGHRTFETRARPIFDEHGAVTGTVTVSQDVTDRVNLEQSLRRATIEAERASEAKSQFLSRMSHELRTPLNAILGFAQLLELDDLPEDQASSVDQIRRAGRHLLALINEVLDISRIESGQLSISTQAVRVEDVLQEVINLLSPAAEAAAVHLVVHIDSDRDLLVRADRQRLLQVLLNLGSNAVKYNERGGSVAFRTSTTAGGGVRFSVHDTGLGIPHEQQDLLFVPFSRLGAERSAVEGTGVGLALSKQLVEVMGGTIGVESYAGRGSTFWVELLPGDAKDLPGGRPGADDPGSTESTPGHEGASGSSVTANSLNPPAEHRDRGRFVVFQVEDNVSNASLVTQVLARRPGVRLLSAGEARLGLELARQHHPDLILLDLHLPDMAGDELLYRIKSIPELAHTRIVVVSADATPSRIRRMLDLGVEGYLTKPVDVEALLRLVDSQVDGRVGTPDAGPPPGS